jgi:hypothetical protein
MAAGLLALHREGFRHPQRPLAAGTAPWGLRAASCTVAQLAATRGTFTASAFVGTGGTAAQKLGEKTRGAMKNYRSHCYSFLNQWYSSCIVQYYSIDLV